MKFISLCSGIEAASVAFGPLGWMAIAFSEIEAFPSAVLAHHYPTIPNMGDMSQFEAWPEQLFIDADAIVGGPPCQAFSIAGARAGLDDPRGNLTITYSKLINHADAIRLRHGLPPVVCLYENVPGLLSDKTGAFGCLLAGLSGEECELVPPGKRWTDAGVVLGPQRAVAWRILDAQFFGLAQRRRRVFVVASARNDFDPAAVLFEWDGVRRDFAPSREAREEVTGTLGARTQGGGGLGTDFDVAGGVQPVAGTLGANHGNIKAEHAWTGQLLPVAGTLCIATGQGGAEIGAEIAPTLNCNHEAPYIAKPAFAAAFKGGQGSAAGSIGYSEHVAPTLSSADSGSNRTPVVLTHIMQVRRLTPRECERLQGFPDDLAQGYTAVPNRGKPAADGPRYKALGNSWAIPCVSWIGKRIKAAL